jgi:hypothetical protein
MVRAYMAVNAKVATVLGSIPAYTVNVGFIRFKYVVLAKY